MMSQYFSNVFSGHAGMPADGWHCCVQLVSHIWLERLSSHIITWTATAYVQHVGLEQISFYLRLVQTMADQLAKMQNLYDSLASQLSEATVNPESLPQSFGCILSFTLEIKFIHGPIYQCLLFWFQLPTAQDIADTHVHVVSSYSPYCPHCL